MLIPLGMTSTGFWPTEGPLANKIECCWHTRQLKLCMVQINGGPCPWCKPKSEAETRFFNAKIDDSGINACTGRMGN